MDPLSTLLSFSFLIFSLLVGGIIFILRTVVEYFWSKVIDSKFWAEIVLPILPVLLGGTLAYLAPMYPYGSGFTSISGRIAFGVVAGLLSGFIYRVIKSLLNQKLIAIIQPSNTATTSILSNSNTTTTTEVSSDVNANIPSPPTMGQNPNIDK